MDKSPLTNMSNQFFVESTKKGFNKFVMDKFKARKRIRMSDAHKIRYKARELEQVKEEEEQE